MNQIEVLSQDQIATVHGNSLELLRDLGMQLPHAGVLEALEGAGAQVDHEKQIARFPEKLVEESVEIAGKKYVIYGRDGSKTARFGYGDFVVVSSGGQFAWVDEDGAERRTPTAEDMELGILFGDALENMTIVGPLCVPQDVPANARDVYSAAQLMKGTTKPVHFWVTNGATLKYVLEIYEAIAGGKNEHREKPRIAGFIEPISPLRFPLTGLEIMVGCVEVGLPLCFGPMAQVGATAPCSLAGTFVQENAEILGGIAIAQALQPGTPVCYGGIPHLMDMRTAMISFGSPEQALMAVAMTQMAKHYGLPVYINVGAGDSKRVDVQSGLERGMTLLAGAFAGADTFGHMGISGMDQGASIEQLIVDNEMINYVKRILQGFDFDEDALAMQVIKSVGIGGHYMDEAHTYERFRRDFWYPDGFDRRGYQEWRDDGAKSMLDWAKQRKNQIIDDHEREPLDADLARELDRIVATAFKEVPELA